MAADKECSSIYIASSRFSRENTSSCTHKSTTYGEMLNTCHEGLLCRDAAQRIQLARLTSRLRTNVNKAAPPNAHIPLEAVIYGIDNTDVFKPVTAESLTKRMGIAEAIAPHTTLPRDKMNYRKSLRARKLVEMHQPFLDSVHGPFESIR